MTAKTTYTATAPDGSTFTRTSAAPVAFAVLATDAEGVWGYWAWSSRLDLAEKAAEKARRVSGAVVIVPASPEA